MTMTMTTTMTIMMFAYEVFSIMYSKFVAL